MKRAATAGITAGARAAKKPRAGGRPAIQIPEYHATPSRRGENGEIIWPAPEEKMEAARQFIRDWSVSTLVTNSCFP
jgi:hypothetical protein